MINPSSPDSKNVTGKLVVQFLLLLLITFLVHAFVLRFIFPGFYYPLSAQHEDHYIPASFAYASHPDYRDLANWTRPVFMIFYKLIGHAGTAGSIGFVIGLVFLNCLLSALLIKRVLGLSFDGTFLFIYLVYCYLLFATPYFYILYTQDVGSHLCYFFLILGALLFYHTLNKSILLSAGLLFICCTLAFLSKETYQLVALFFAFLWFFYDRKASLKRSLVPLAATIAAFMIATYNNMRLHSVFVNVKATKGSPYEVSLSPLSVLHQWVRYAKVGVNIADLLIICLIGYIVFRSGETWRKKLLFLFAACFLAAPISWLPNAVLPNHHIDGYSFNGLQLFYLPLFFLPFLFKQRLMTYRVIAVIPALLLANHFLNIYRYRSSSNSWALRQENTQRNFLHSLDSLIGRLTPAPKLHKILVEGLTFPFHPFTYPESLREYPHAAEALYDVVYYTPDPRYEGRRDLVKFIPPSDTLLTRYDQVWSFRSDGSLARIGTGQGASRGDSLRISIDLQNLSDFKTEGMYPPEGQSVWTNGHSSIELNTAIRSNDSLTVILYTYLPPLSRNVVPGISLADTAGKEYHPMQMERKKDVFYYHFIFNKRIFIKKAIISSQLIDSGPDGRALSFLFERLVIK